MIAAVQLTKDPGTLAGVIAAIVLGVGTVVYVLYQVRSMYLREIRFWKNEVKRSDAEISRLHKEMINIITMSSSMRYAARPQTKSPSPDEQKRRREEAEAQKRKRRAEKVRNLAERSDNAHEAALAKSLASELNKPKQPEEKKKKAS